ncbi:hypothetical protein [Paenibacillus xerothermodurans]|uniref:Sporulation membrane protein YtrI C-terminal domain-containing protein n=1 Tax=Paenibacillus xerothermodurans TaxID=1977292 RepID=A0A2W1NBY9_PAEXE|nr:hypothetical protein [Paenibacillus xerothermodurans]PZE21464.1 hypothetical protein CBW46_008955 [Paenibacillus xerothermodurans]
MKVPPSEQFRGLIKSLGLLIAGAIIGCAAFTAIFHHHLNSVLVKNTELIAENEKLIQDNDLYKRHRTQQNIINRIEVTVEPDDLNSLDKVTAQELEKKVRNELSVLKGQKVASFSEAPHIYQRLLSNKTYHDILDKDYIVNVKTMLLVQTELKVWITAKQWVRSIP